MKKLFYAFLGLFVLVAILASSVQAGLIGVLTRKHQSWAFIESVGGMKVHVMGRELVVHCDVSGTQTVTKKPTLVNSGIGVRKTKCLQLDHLLRLSVITSALEEGMISTCSSIDLSAYRPGRYVVEYLDPDGSNHPVGQILLQ